MFCYVCLRWLSGWVRLPSDNTDHPSLIPRKEKKQLLKAVIGPPHTKWHVCAHKHTNTQYMKKIYTQDMREGSLYGGG